MRITTLRFSRAALVALAILAISVNASAQQVDMSKVEIKATKLANNFYELEGNGGNIGVLVGPDGVLMVDSQFAPLSEKIAAAVKKLNPGAIRFMINTHVHGDHTGGNENFAKMGTIIFSQDQLRYRLAHPNPGANGAPGTPAPAMALPMITYRGPVTIHINGEDVELIPIPAAHTDGDTLVRFPGQDVIMIGDYFRSLGYPNIDRGNGGSLKGMIDGIGVAIGLSGPNTKIVPGHGVVVDRNGLIAHRDMMLTVSDRVSKLITQGKTLEEVMAAKPTADFDAKVPDATATTVRFLTQIYAELKTAKTD